jgi:hypothetical protein
MELMCRFLSQTLYKLLLIFIASISVFFINTTSAFAIVNPTEVSNNKVGIHILSENDLEDAYQLINSSGGDWGYVTVVITEAERDKERWQNAFDQMRRKHIIPIIRLATKPSGANWDAPQEAEINNWVAFLNSLNWVTKNRYVIINNEPNHSKEWGGRLDPAGYAKYLKQISKKLKEASPDFYILPAGLDPAAANRNPTMSSSKFIREMILAEPDVFDFIDGWTSHPYPNASITSYKSELQIINKKLPVFITETGWTLEKYSEPEVTKNIIDAYKNVWNDPEIVAVTPFILNYDSPPFNYFSWKKSNGTFYTYYTEVKNMPKVKGDPVQVESGQILGAFVEPIMFSKMDFVGAILAKNTGQTIWTKENLSLGSESGDLILKSLSLNNIEPMKLGLIFFKAASKQDSGIYVNTVYLNNLKGEKITNSFSIEGAFVKFGKDNINKILSILTRNLFQLP